MAGAAMTILMTLAAEAGGKFHVSGDRLMMDGKLHIHWDEDGITVERVLDA